MNKLIFYVKPTERCNTRCLHCYNYRVDGGVELDLGDYYEFMLSVGSYLSNCGEDLKIDLVLHGGEPTLVGIPKLIEIVKATRAALPFVHLQCSIQTNLLRYDGNLRDFVRMYTDNILGTSYSPTVRFLVPEDYGVWLNNLVRAVADGICVYLIITLSKAYVEAYDPASLVDFILENKIYGFHFEPLTKDGNAVVNWDKIAVDVDSYDAWKTSFTREFIKRGAYQTAVYNEITRKAKVFFGGEFVGCCSRKCYQTVFTINSDGTVGGCPNKSRSEVFGSIKDGFSKILGSHLRRELILKERMRRFECLECDYFRYCNGGCVQTDGCYEGKRFYSLLKKECESNLAFRDWIKCGEVAGGVCF